MGRFRNLYYLLHGQIKKHIILFITWGDFDTYTILFIIWADLETHTLFDVNNYYYSNCVKNI